MDSLLEIESGSKKGANSVEKRHASSQRTRANMKVLARTSKILLDKQRLKVKVKDLLKSLLQRRNFVSIILLLMCFFNYSID